MRWPAITISRAAPSNTALFGSSPPNSACAVASDSPMRFPARLTLALAQARLARPASRSQVVEHFQYLDAEEILNSAAAHPVSLEKLDSALAARKPFVWVSGTEPLEHPGVAHLVRALARPGRFVFLE